MDTMGFDEDEMEGLDIIGAESAAPLARRIRAAAALRGGKAAPAWAKHLSGQGVSRPAEELDFLPFQVTQFATGVLAAGATTFAEAFPQRPFRGERLIASAIRTNAGTSVDVSSGILISPAIFVGAVQVGASQGTVPLSAFAANAFGVRLAMPPAGQGTRVFIPLTLGFAQVAGDSTVISLMIVGRAVR